MCNRKNRHFSGRGFRDLPRTDIIEQMQIIFKQYRGGKLYFY